MGFPSNMDSILQEFQCRALIYVKNLSLNQSRDTSKPAGTPTSPFFMLQQATQNIVMTVNFQTTPVDKGAAAQVETSFFGDD